MFKRNQGLRLTDISNCAGLVFVYHSPPIWQTLTLGRDLFYNTRYDDELDIFHPGNTHREDDDFGILRFFGTTGVSLPMLLEAFEEGEKEKSRFGFNAESIRAMQGASLVHRLQRNYKQAESELKEALTCTQRISEADRQIQTRIQYELGEIYLEQGNIEQAARTFLLVEIALTGHKDMDATFLRANLFRSLATIALQRRRLLQAQSLLARAISSTSSLCGSTESLYFTLCVQMSTVYCAQGCLKEARALCEMVLAKQKARLGLHNYHTLRTEFCLAYVLREQRLSYESMTLYRQLLPRLCAILGPEHEYTLTTTETLTQMLFRVGDLDEAESLCRRLCDDCDKGLGEDNPTTWEAKFLLAQALKDKKKDSDAVMILQRLLQRIETIHGLNNSVGRRILYVLDYLYRRQGEAGIAEDVRKRLRTRQADSSGKFPLAI